MKGYAVLVFVTMLAAGCAASKAVTTPSVPANALAGRPAGEVIFEFGREDKGNFELRSTGLAGIAEYRCRVGVDCSTEAFPAYLLRAGYSGYEDGGVERIELSFALKQTYADAVLRLVRGGDETTVVRVDGRKKYLVTKAMLGSREGFGVGAYNLKLGTLRKGEHRIELTVADDGEGNAVYQWDALALFAK